MFRKISIILFFAALTQVISKRVKSGDLIIGISVAPKADGPALRTLIRNYQINTYQYLGHKITWKFVVAIPEDNDIDFILRENDIYHDIILLDNIQDNRTFARKDKPYYFFKYLIDNGFHYKYVAKMDTDTFLNITGFVEHYFTEKIRNQNSTIIAYQNKYGNIKFPAGAIYAISWDLVEKLSKVYHEKSIPRVTDDEDVQIAYYLKAMKENVTYAWISNEHNFDYHVTLDEAQVRKVFITNFENKIRVHELKTTEKYEKVAKIYKKHAEKHERDLAQRERAREQMLRKIKWSYNPHYNYVSE